MTARRILTVTDAWFDLTPDGSVLRIAFDASVSMPDDFEVSATGITTFTRITTLKGRQVFEATRARPQGVEDRPEQGPLWLLEGPLQRGPRDVA